MRLGENHFWLSLADSDVLLWAKGVAYHAGMQVTITEPDVGPLQIQGPKSREVMTDLFGAENSSNAATYFATGIKGRPDETNYQDHIARDGVFEIAVPEGETGISVAAGLESLELRPGR